MLGGEGRRLGTRESKKPTRGPLFGLQSREIRMVGLLKVWETKVPHDGMVRWMDGLVRSMAWSDGAWSDSDGGTQNVVSLTSSCTVHHHSPGGSVTCRGTTIVIRRFVRTVLYHVFVRAHITRRTSSGCL